MKKSTFILVLLMVFAPLFVNAQTQNVELGLQVGAGFFMGNSNPATGYTRIHEFAWMRDSEGIPAFETFGGVVRYRFDTRWALQAQAMHQRTRFKESTGNRSLYFYNSMWNVDLMAEFNILKYGFTRNRNARIYTITPYVAAGIGTSLYNKTATYRWGMKTGKRNTAFPAIKASDLAASLYVPFALGFKLRVASNWQFKMACQYNLYVLNGNLDGSTKGTEPYRADKGGVSYENADYVAGSTHNIAVTIGMIYNLPAKGRSGEAINY